MAGGRWDRLYLDDTFNYIPDCAVHDFTGIVRSGGNLILSFPTVPGITYTLWHSDTAADGTWTDTGLPALPGTGAIRAFAVSATTPARRFFRVQAAP